MRSEPFSVPFRVSNTGLTALRNVRIILYVRRVVVAGGIIRKSTVNTNRSGPSRLDRGESATIVFLLVSKSGIPKEADVAVVVDYQIPWLPFFSFRRYFRFVGQYGDDWQWLSEPSGNIQGEADEMVNRANRPRTAP